MSHTSIGFPFSVQCNLFLTATLGWLTRVKPQYTQLNNSHALILSVYMLLYSYGAGLHSATMLSWGKAWASTPYSMLLIFLIHLSFYLLIMCVFWLTPIFIYLIAFLSVLNNGNGA